jgi:hypothetical protein
MYYYEVVTKTATVRIAFTHYFHVETITGVFALSNQSNLRALSSRPSPLSVRKRCSTTRSFPAVILTSTRSRRRTTAPTATARPCPTACSSPSWSCASARSSTPSRSSGRASCSCPTLRPTCPSPTGSVPSRTASGRWRPDRRPGEGRHRRAPTPAPKASACFSLSSLSL